MKDITIRWHKSTDEIKEYIWKGFMNNKSNPFFEWSWLNQLEKSHSVEPNTGWQPLHISLSRNENIVAIAPLYLKAHSYGEFIFDQNYYQLALDLGLKYYPKLIGMSPLSPIEGYRFLIAPNENEMEITLLIMKAIDKFAKKNNILSCNFLYVDSNWAKIAEQANCAKWLNKHSIWLADGKQNFSDYLSSFNANQRRNIKRERKSLIDSGMHISTYTGDQITESLMIDMHAFYELHCSKWGVWGSKYLSESFFKALANSHHKKNLVLFSANNEDSKHPLAMSMCIANDNKLWGRYWGATVEINCLHFELCYYSPISWALNHGIESFDPGAGGNHKLRRGFQTKANISLHRWYNQKMDYLIREWLQHSNKLVIEEIEAINNQLPFTAKATSI